MKASPSLALLPQGAVKVKVITDHRPKTFLISKPAVQLTRRQVRWQEFLSNIKFEWEYIKGKANVADPLSWAPTLMTALIQHEMMYAPDWAISSHDLLGSLKLGYDKNPWFKIQTHVSPLTFENGFWIRGKLIVVPGANDLRKQILPSS